MPTFSRLDGWAIESYKMNGGGFPITDKQSFYNLLEYKIIPKYYCNLSNMWVTEMKLSIGNAGSFFNTHRMAKEYVELAYKLKYEQIREN